MHALYLLQLHEDRAYIHYIAVHGMSVFFKDVIESSRVCARNCKRYVVLKIRSFVRCLDDASLTSLNQVSHKAHGGLCRECDGFRSEENDAADSDM